MSETHVRSLVRKLEAWVQQQPEWVFLMTQGSRAQRREAARLMSAVLFTIPKREAQQPVGRAERRRIEQEVQRALDELRKQQEDAVLLEGTREFHEALMEDSTMYPSEGPLGD